MSTTALNRPNILLISSDQHRSDAMGCSGHPVVRTPHLDQIAREGVRFSRATTECPVCIPARTGLISGIHPVSYGKPSYADWFRLERPREQLLGGLLTGAGYQTMLVGKRHWHRDPSCTGGFETVVPISRCKKEQALAQRGWAAAPGLGGNEVIGSMSPLPPHLYSTDWTIEHCCELLTERDEARPFFMWCSMVDPHPPLYIHEPFYSMYQNSDIPDPVIGDWEEGEGCPLDHRVHIESRGKRSNAEGLRHAAAVYYGMITNMDYQLGRLFGVMQRLKLYENTLIIYLSDHGEMFGDHHDTAKSSFYRSASDIPMIVRAPKDWNCAPGRTSEALVGLTDILPTLAAAGGAKVPEDVEGKNLRPLLDGTQDSVRDTFIGGIDGRYLVDNGTHRYLYHVRDGAEQLFAAEDKCDRHALPLDEAIVKPLRERLVAYLAGVSSPDVVDGALRNAGGSVTDWASVRAKNPLGMGGHSGRYLSL